MDKSSIKIVFFGSFGFAVPTLEALKNEGYEVVAVITNPDKLSGRKKILTSPPVKLAAQKLGLQILQPEKLKDNSVLLEKLKILLEARNQQPATSFGVVVGYGKIIPPEIFNLPKHGTLNIHPSLLPKYRGPSPVQTAMINGDAETGVTIMKLDEEVDHGEIISNIKYQISNVDNYKTLHTKLFELGAELLIKILPDYLSGKIKPQPQDHLRATHTHKFTSKDSEIKKTDTAEQAYNKIRALNPEPGAFIWFSAKGSPRSSESGAGGSASRSGSENPSGSRTTGGEKMRLKILEAELKNGRLEFKNVQLEGGKKMDIKEFLRGHPNFKRNLL